MLEQIEMVLDAQKSYAQVDKDGNMKNRVWGQVMCLNPAVEKKTVKKINETQQSHWLTHTVSLA